jgi:hypothetical protein
MKATCSSETSVDFERTIRRYIPQDRTLHNLKFYVKILFRGIKCVKFIVKHSVLFTACVNLRVTSVRRQKHAATNSSKNNNHYGGSNQTTIRPPRPFSFATPSGSSSVKCLAMWWAALTYNGAHLHSIFPPNSDHTTCRSWSLPFRYNIPAGRVLLLPKQYSNHKLGGSMLRTRRSCVDNSSTSFRGTRAQASF